MSIYDLFEVRIELRSVRDQARFRTRTVGRCCRACALRDFDKPVTQMELIS